MINLNLPTAQSLFPGHHLKAIIHDGLHYGYSAIVDGNYWQGQDLMELCQRIIQHYKNTASPAIEVDKIQYPYAAKIDIAGPDMVICVGATTEAQVDAALEVMGRHQRVVRRVKVTPETEVRL